MAIYERNRFEGVTVELDGHIFEHNAFVRCTILYRGGVPPVLKHNHFKNCVFALDGPAANTVRFLRELLEEGGLRPVALAWLGLKDGLFELALESKAEATGPGTKADA